MKASAIIVAAGSGVRLGSDVPKAFVKLAGRTMLSWSLVTVRQVSSIGEVVITIPEGFEDAARAEVAAAGLALPVKITPGGIERQDSVRIALGLTSAESDLVIVHDAARPLATPAIFEACLIAAARAGGAIAAIPVSDTLKRVADRAIIATIARAELWQAQTPQAFRRDLLVAAHQAHSPKKSPPPTTPTWSSAPAPASKCSNARPPTSRSRRRRTWQSSKQSSRDLTPRKSKRPVLRAHSGGFDQADQLST